MSARSNIIKLTILAFITLCLGGFLGGCNSAPRTTTYTETFVNPDGSRTVLEKKVETTGGSIFEGVNARRYSSPGYYGGSRRYVEWGTDNCGVGYHTAGLKEPHKHVWGKNKGCK